jgi:hypothetical protein
MKSAVLTLLVGLAAVLGQACPAAATTLGVSYSGTVTLVDPDGAGTFAVNDTFTFNILVNDAAPDTDPSAGIGDYHGVTQFNGSFSNGYSFASTTGTDRVIVYDGLADGVEFNGHHFTAPNVGDFHLQLVSAMFNDSTATMNGSDALPMNLVTLLTLSDSQSVFLQFIDSGVNAFGVLLKISSATAIPVATTPIPATMPLLATALGGLGFLGWKRRRIA